MIRTLRKLGVEGNAFNLITSMKNTPNVLMVEY